VSAQEAPGERATVEQAIRTTPNLGAAAKRLDVARKTLYNRMRSLGLPAGKSGRPKRSLGGVQLGAVLPAVGVVALILALTAYTAASVRERKSTLVGLDLLGAS
jgi:hypothetical protein